MKCKRLFAGAMALAMLCSGCTKNDAANTVDAASSYDRLAQELTAWDGSQNLSIATTAELFTEYAGVPGATRFSGQYMQQQGENGTEIYASQNFDYGDGNFYEILLLSDGKLHAINTQSGPLDPESEEENLVYGEYLGETEFMNNVAYGIPLLAFEKSQIKQTAMSAGENDKTLITFTLDPKTSEDSVIMLLEGLNYIDTESVPVDADVSSISCTATYQDDALLNLSYKFSADLTAEGEVLEIDYLYNWLLMESGELVSFGMPSVNTLVTQ